MFQLSVQPGKLTAGHHRCCSLRHLQRRPVQWRSCWQRCRAQSEAEIREAMKDPKIQAKMQEMQEAMKRPEVQKEMQQMASMMQNKEMMAKMQELQNDPELKPMFEEMRTGGMGAMMKYWNDPKVIAKVGSKMGSVPMPSTISPAAPTAVAAPEVTTLLEAGRYGDVEAAEDFIAIGKDVNEADKDGRTPLHYAIAYDHFQVLETLLAARAYLESRDAKQNTPLHYAAGYARPDFIKRLLQAGSGKGPKNDSGKTPYDLIKGEPRNPLHGDEEVLALLQL